MLAISRLVPAALVLAACLTVPAGHAAPPTDPAQRAALIGQPKALLVQPEGLRLTGPRSRQQVVVTGQYDDGSVRDLTALCDFRCESDVATVTAGGFLSPQQNGTTSLVVTAGPASVKVPLTVADLDKP